ncbi:MYB-like transcription factor ETC1 isoform X1 [Manihot esculenta]|uniref:MYB-like transcription factor ETC1 isoform X1 n=1 Tax=Manihot esculenta TaxID=3983 RepID=UPI000B5D54EC|nr:MYB-like transcription factor ETC1 isoform X1 [Manihot esculenta]
MAESEHSSSDETYVNSQVLVLSCLVSERRNLEARLEFSEEEEELVIRMFNLVGERWPLIAGRIPGKTAEEIEKYWKSRYSTSE